mgnify:FL=1
MSLVMAFNLVGYSAFAAKANENLVDESLIDQSINAEEQQLKRSFDQITALIKSIETYKAGAQGEKQNAFVNAARLMITVLGLANTVKHIKNVKAESSIELTLAAVMGALSSTLEMYVSKQKIDMGEVKELLNKKQEELIATASESNNEDAVLIVDAVKKLSEISDSLNSQMNNIQQLIDEGQTDVAITAIITLVLNYAAPFLPKKMKEIVANKAPTALGLAVKTKRRSMQALGGTNIATLLSTVVGMGSKSSQDQLNMILSNLRLTQANIAAALK